jgi:hypothetical protein
MCRQRNLTTPRVYCFESDEVPMYIVQPRGDPEYDEDHQEFVTAFFASGNTMDDFYHMCNTWDDSGDIVDCGLAEVEPIRPLKASATTAIHIADRVSRAVIANLSTYGKPLSTFSPQDYSGSQAG